MNKMKIAVIFEDEEIMFISSYSYRGDYRPKWGDSLDSERVKICLTDDIDSACKWIHEYQIETVCRTLKDCLLKNPNIKSVYRVNPNVFKRYLKIKNLKEKCQKTN